MPASMFEKVKFASLIPGSLFHLPGVDGHFEKIEGEGHFAKRFNPDGTFTGTISTSSKEFNTVLIMVEEESYESEEEDETKTS